LRKKTMKNIPVVTVYRKTLAEAYESAIINTFAQGTKFKTQYDKPEDPPSLDCTLNLTIEDPLRDPMIHKAFPGGFKDLREYVYELQGLKDGWMKNMDDGKDTRWEYTYHFRFKHYGSWKESNGIKGICDVDQIEYVINKLVEQPFTRQAQMVTWIPKTDLTIYDPPCLQSCWYRILEDEEGVYWLNCNVRIRSNDAWGASFMNMFGFIMFNQEVIANQIAERTGKTVKLGRMNWQADSYHIYGKDIKDVNNRLMDRLNKTNFEDRVFNFYDEMVQEMYHEEEEKILANIKEMNEKYSNG